MSGKVLLVIDVANDFVDPKGVLFCKTALKVLPKIEQLINAARKNSVPVLFPTDVHLKGDRELSLWGPHAMKGTWGAEIVDQLKPIDHSEIVEKRWYSGFTDTNLDEKLKKFGVKELYITGLHTNICDRHTSYDGYVRGYNIIVVTDATGTFTPEEHEAGLGYIEQMYEAKRKTTKEVIKEFEFR